MPCAACGGELLVVGLMAGCKKCGAVSGRGSKRLEEDEERNNAAYKRWKKAVQSRDGFRCQFRGCGRMTKLETHHIKRWKDDLSIRYEPSNGITLCFDCHHAIQDKEDEMAEELSATVKALMAQDPTMNVLFSKYKK